MKYEAGNIIEEFESKTGHVIFRYPKNDDVDMLQSFINKMSQEDTYVTFSGEFISLEDERSFLSGKIEEMKSGDCVFIIVEIDKKIVGTCEITRDFKGKKRSFHIGVFGISLDKEIRGFGIGKKLVEAVISESALRINGLKKILLHVYSENKIAFSLYEKYGFKKVGIIPGGIYFHDKYIDEIIMVRDL